MNIAISRYKFITILFILTQLMFSQCFASSMQNADKTELKAILSGNFKEIDKLAHHGSCLSTVYLNSINTNKIPDTTRKVCSECELFKGNFYYFYNCNIIRHNEFSNNYQYDKAKEYLEKIINSLDENIEDRNAIQTSLKNKIQLLELAKQQRVSMRKKVKVENMDAVSLKINKEDVTFTLDTRAEFSAIKTIKNHLTQGAKSYQVKSYSGKISSTLATLIETSNEETLLFYNNSMYNLLGLNYIRQFEEIEFNNTEVGKTSSSTPLYQDGTNLFFRAQLFTPYKSMAINSCIDTGAKETIITPKLYREVRHHYLNREILQFSYDDFNGENVNLAKLLDYGEIVIEDFKIIIQDTPMLFRLAQESVCDVVLGQDVLKKNLHKINFKSNSVTFNGINSRFHRGD